MRTCLVVVALALVARTASAQPPGETPAQPAPRKSLATAYLVTIAATAAPLAIAALGAEDGDGQGSRARASGVLGVAALVLGPSAGHWYAGGRVTTGLILRAGAAGAVAALALHDPQLEDPVPTVMGLLAATALWETGVIWDAVTLPRAVRRYNRAHQVQVAPLVTAHGPATGLSIAGRF